MQRAAAECRRNKIEKPLMWLSTEKAFNCIKIAGRRQTLSDADNAHSFIRPEPRHLCNTWKRFLQQSRLCRREEIQMPATCSPTSPCVAARRRRKSSGGENELVPHARLSLCWCHDVRSRVGGETPSATIRKSPAPEQTSSALVNISSPQPATFPSTTRRGSRSCRFLRAHLWFF